MTSPPAGSEYRYVAEYFTEHGEELAVLPLDPDFGPAMECCQLAGVSAGVLSSTATLPPGSIVPVWAGEAGPPYVEALHVSMEAGRGDDPVVVDLDASLYLRAAIRLGAARLVEQKRIEAGTRYRHRVAAYPDRGARVQRAAQRTAAARNPRDADGLLDFDVDCGDDVVAIVERSLAALTGGRVPAEGDPCPVVVHAVVLRDLLALAEAAGDSECGAGILGHLARDQKSGRLFVEVTALAPVRGGVSEQRAFVFTDESWASVHEIARLRGAGELVCGYAHSHPNFCVKCAPEKQAVCAAARPFFSDDDVHLQRACFAKAWQVALLASDLPREGRVLSLFGWQGGVIAERNFLTAADVPHERARDAAPFTDNTRGVNP